VKRRHLLIGVGTAAVAGCIDPYADASSDRLDASGDLAIVVDGAPVDLSADRFQAEHAENASVAFHLHAGDDRWYMEGERRLTVAAGLDRLPHITFAVHDGVPVVTIDGTTYDAGTAGTTVTVTVNGEPVAPDAYELHDGDAIRVTIEPGG